MISSYGDDDFEIRVGSYVRPTKCLAVEPGVVFLPGRCVGALGHQGAHHSAVSYVGPFDGQPLRPSYWDNDDD